MRGKKKKTRASKQSTQEWASGGAAERNDYKMENKMKLASENGRGSLSSFVKLEPLQAFVDLPVSMEVGRGRIK